MSYHLPLSVVPDLVAALHLRDSRKRAASPGIEDDRVAVASQQQIVLRPKREPSGVASSQWVDLHHALLQGINDRHLTSRVRCGLWDGHIELVRHRIPGRRFQSGAGIGKDDLAHNFAMVDRDEGDERWRVRSIGDQQQLLQGIVGDFIRSFFPTGRERGDTGRSETLRTG